MRQKQIRDIDRAIELVSEAIACGGFDEAFSLVYTKQLSSCLEQRYRVSKNVRDLDLAIQMGRDVLGKSMHVPRLFSYTFVVKILICEILEKANTSNPLRDRWNMDLGVMLDRRFQCTTDVKEREAYLSEALSNQEESVNKLTANHPDFVWYLCTLGIYRVHLNDLLPENERNQRKSNYLSAISAYQQGFKQLYATPYSRIRCGMLAGSCYIALKDWAPASKILSDSIQMFQRISPLALDENDRQHRLSGLTGMSTDACIAYIMMGDPEAGIEILEAGRGIMSNIVMRQQDELLGLKGVSSSLHSQYIALRHSLSLPLPTKNLQGQDAVAIRIQDQLKFEEIEESIRQLPGLEKFNKNISSQQIQQLADRGPLVSFCVDDNRAFAIIITKDVIEALPLPELLRDDIRKMIPLVIGDTRLSLWKPTLRAKANTKMRRLLAWLWDTAIKPVLSHLKLLQDGTQPFQPRLWWVTSGTLGLMPLHAAGKGSKEPLENTYTHIVSSYASTFSALAFARKCQSRVFSKRSGAPNVTLVTMPRTPARSPLATEAEAQAIRDAFKSSMFDYSGLFELCQPMAEEVQRRVRGCNIDIFHYSGHAEADLEDPSKSALLFGSDPDALAPDPLPIDRLRKYDGVASFESQTSQLAYLSACCTAQQNELKLLDENIHLAAIFQAMGFPAVIGTLWEADDKAAAFIAKAFYENLIEMSNASQEADGNVAREDHVVRALHAATAACRAAKFGKADGAKDVLLWANFVHFGA
jgi:CHAT domain-containing protein